MAVNGKWNISIQSPVGDREAQLALTEGDGGALTGTMTGDMGDVPVENGKNDDGTLKWECKISSPMPMTLEFSGAVDGDAISGSVKLGMFGESKFSGTAA